MSQGSDARRAIKELADGVKRVFKKYSRSARRASWDGLTNSKGDRLVKQLIDNPSKPIVGIERILRFREWYEINTKDNDPPTMK